MREGRGPVRYIGYIVTYIWAGKFDRPGFSSLKFFIPVMKELDMAFARLAASNFIIIPADWYCMVVHTVPTPCLPVFNSNSAADKGVFFCPHQISRI